jgi:hypothetical protein
MSVIRDGDLDHRRDIGNEAAVDGDAAATTRWQRLPPRSLRQDQACRAAVRYRSDKARSGAIVWVIDALALRSIFLGSPMSSRKYSRESRPARAAISSASEQTARGVWDVEHRPIPADTHMGARRTVLVAHVRNRIGHVDSSPALPRVTFGWKVDWIGGKIASCY